MNGPPSPAEDPSGFVVAKRLLWTPRAKQRPHTTYTKGRPRTYTPKETVDAERSLRCQWVGYPMEGPIGVWVLMSDDHIDVTVSQVETRTQPKLRRGDIDNYSKLILDALNGVAWVDDRQIDVLHVEKL